MNPFFSCALLTVFYLLLFFIWGRAVLTFIHAEVCFCDSLIFGYIFLQAVFQVLYLPFLLSRGSFRVLSYLWVVSAGLITVFMVIYLKRQNHSNEKLLPSKGRRAAAYITSFLVVVLSLLIASRPRYYGADTYGYINPMNEMYYNDTIWIVGGGLYLHSGLNSIFSLFTISSVFTGIRPIYVAQFTMREIMIVLSSSIVYRTGRCLFSKKEDGISDAGIVLVIITIAILMAWESMFVTHFFYMRSNEAKAYCQFVLLPLAFSIWLQMFNEQSDRVIAWKEQLLVGVAAMSVASSSMTAYVFLAVLATIALLSYDRFSHVKGTLKKTALCILPNLMYMGLYLLNKAGILLF